MRKRIVVFLSVILLSLALAPPLSAEEPFSPPVAGSARTVLGYGDAYAAGGTSRVHRGADLTVEAGATVKSCTAGKVTFAGLVPASADTSRTTAVTVTREDGLKTTYMPLAHASVKAGATVEAGDGLGTLAETGDASSPGPHLHLGVRRGDAYLDPASFLAPAAPPAPPAEEPAPVEEPAPEPKPTATPVPATQPAPIHAPAPAPAATPAGVTAPAGQGATSARAAHGGEVAPQSTLRTSPHTGVRTSPGASVVGATSAAARRAVSAAAPLARAAVAASSVARKPAATASSSALAFLADAYGGARKVVTALAELVVASALLWPVWRSVSRPIEPVAAVATAHVSE